MKLMQVNELVLDEGTHWRESARPCPPGRTCGGSGSESVTRHAHGYHACWLEQYSEVIRQRWPAMHRIPCTGGSSSPLSLQHGRLHPVKRCYAADADAVGDTATDAGVYADSAHGICFRSAILA